MVLLSFHFIDEETEDEVTCPRKLQTHALALWLSCQDPQRESFLLEMDWEDKEHADSLAGTGLRG